MNFTTAIHAASLHGETPVGADHTQVHQGLTQPRRPGAPGTEHSRRLHPPTPDEVARMVRRIKAQQAEAGIVIEPPSKGEESNGDLWRWMSRGAERVLQSLPTLSLLPVGEAAPVAIGTQEAKQAEPLGRGGILVPEFDFAPYQSPEEQQTEASTHNDLTKTLKRFAGKDKVHVMPTTGGTPYIRNVVAEGPESMLTSGVPGDHPYAQVRDSAELYFEQKDIKYQRIQGEVNFANVEFIPENDLLVMAHGDRASIISPAMKRELTRVFGNPAHVIHLELNAERLNSHGAPICYDLDLAFHAMTNAEGESIALVHKPCIKQKASPGRMGREEALQTLRQLGYKVIEISEADQKNLAANSVSLDESPGKLLFSSKAISKELKHQLEEHHVTPVFPVGDKVLGHPAVDALAGYGLHCLTVNLRRPEAEIPEKKEL